MYEAAQSAYLRINAEEYVVAMKHFCSFTVTKMHRKLLKIYVAKFINAQAVLPVQVSRTTNFFPGMQSSDDGRVLREN